MLGGNGHLAPAKHPLALGGNRLLQQTLKSPSRLLLARQEAHQHPVAAARGQLEFDLGPQQLVGHLHEDAGAVAGTRVGTVGPAMLEVLQGLDRHRDHLMRGRIVQACDHADATRVVLEARVVESDGRRRLHVR